jgi:hypothetical protein
MQQGPPAADRSEAIPIRVVHERPMGSKKHPVGSPRNTTQLPARGSSPMPASASPRLERSHSEPPKAFTQRLLAGQKPSAAPIPEAGTPPPSSYGSKPNLQVPESPNHHNLSTSASAPSVPTTSPHSSQFPAGPVPPPRRPSPTKSKQQAAAPEEERKDSGSGQQIRHIPIFVEGRNDPVFSTKLNREKEGGDHQQQSQFTKKPSDFYPPGVTKVKQQAPHRQQNAPAQQQQARPSDLNVKNREVNNVEPTSPLGPPPGPIPMGCSSAHLTMAKTMEPTSPMPVEEGVVIPLPCSPDLYNIQKKEEEKAAAEKMAEDKRKFLQQQLQQQQQQQQEQDRKKKLEDESDSAPKRKMSKEEIVQGQIEKVEMAVSELAKKIAGFKGDKNDKEYLFLDEMLTRHLLSLDSVETHGNEDLRKMRKESIKSINRCLSMLDTRAKQKHQNGDADANNSVLKQLAEKSKKEEELAAAELARMNVEGKRK